MQHAGGISGLIELREPQLSQDYPDKAFLNANRYWIICEAYWNRKRIFLHFQAEDRTLHLRKLEQYLARLTSLLEDITVLLAYPQILNLGALQISKRTECLL